jgi:urease accessory protein
MQVTNDIFTKEDGEFLLRNDALEAGRIRAVQTGGCPHAAIREDISVNIAPLEELTALYNTDFLLIESGGGECYGAYRFSFQAVSFTSVPLPCYLAKIPNAT